jgi:hypothetical protein
MNRDWVRRHQKKRVEPKAPLPEQAIDTSIAEIEVLDDEG